jgi:flagellar hook-associated protein 2
MARIQSSVGLITGVPIAETVDQLIAISARPRDLLVQRSKQLQAEQVALSEVTALVVGLQLASRRLGDESLFQRKQVTSSNEDLVSAAITGNPAEGTFRFTPVQIAQKHQVLSDGFAQRDEPLGAGEFSVRFGGFVDRGLSLDELNGGQGVERGRIRITDRSGASAVIDLRYALTVDDVLQAINSADGIDVTASAVGDRLQLVDNTGQTTSNLKVQDVGLTNTATDLGLKVNVAASTATGNDIVHLYEGLDLQRFNDGNGVNIRDGVQHLEVTFRDGSPALQIEFHAQTKGATSSTAVTEAENGVDAQVQLTSVGTGASQDGYRLTFVDDEDVVAGEETVEINTNTKRITVRIDAGNSQAYQVIAAINADETVNQFFTASVSAEGNGSGLVDVSDTATTAGGAPTYRDETTLGDLLTTINAADPTRLQARISASGDRLELVDLTTDTGGAFSVTSLFGGSVAEDLGLTTTASGGVITGRRRLAGLDTVLLDSLAGGQGLGTLGTVNLTDRSGAVAAVNLAAAETLSDVMEAINAAPVAIEASVNGARNGLLLTDVSGGSGNLQVANGDATNSAEKLGIQVSAAVDTVDSGSLNLQAFHEQLTLASLNRGQGVQLGSFLITDSQGNTGAVNLSSSDAETVGDVIDLINALGIGVEAGINDTGDGILLWDTAGGAETLEVTDVGSGTAAADLKLAGTATVVTRHGTPTQVIDGTTSLRVTLDAEATLQDLVDQINEAAAGVSASLFFSGTGTTPYRLSLASATDGSSGEMLIDGSAWGTRFHDVARPTDAVVLVGSNGTSAAPVLAVSSTNDFDQLIDGTTVTLHEASTDEVTVEITATNEPLLEQVKLFVQQYNKLRDKVDTLTAYNEADNTAGILFGSNELLRVESDVSRLITSRFFASRSIESLQDLGLRPNDDGQLTLDEQQFRNKCATDPDAVRQFFTQDTLGVADRFDQLTEQLAGLGNSVLLNRYESLNRTIEGNQRRVTDMNASLSRERERLLKQFYQLETVIQELQSNLTAISQIQYIKPLVSSRD